MIISRPYTLGLLAVAISLSSCEKEPETLFKLLPAESTGIDFINQITESDSFNILTEEYIFNGGGVAVGDFNQDGLPDLFFSGSQVGNRLYLNEGNLKFKDVTEESGVAALDKWSTGVAVVDINYDGFPDLYVCATMKKDSSSRANMLFVNQGLDKDGIPRFAEQAEQYGIADKGYSMNATFFDYDNDGHLDLYVLNNVQGNTVPGTYREKILDGTAVNNDQLYRNNGDGTFTNVTLDAGITIEGFGLGLAVADFNKDGWPDIYVCNDYLANDILYINNGDGTFTNKIKDKMRHQSLFAMGVDASDFNNDGLVDLVTLDMLAETNYRKKTTISKNSYQTFLHNEIWGFEFQHVRNMLQLNNGEDVPFSEIGFMSGVYQTDWSWSPLFVDVDNDGYRDLLVTNGFPRDITDKDFANYRADVGNIASVPHLLSVIPKVKIPNYAFKNNGDLTFANNSKAWGLDISSFSNGAVFVDLDNDGDLDYVVNNINDIAFVYENKAANPASENHFLRLNLTGPATNPYGVGTKVVLHYGDGKIQYHEHHLGRGYLSSVEKEVHFGLGKESQVEKLEVYWQDGKYMRLENVSANQVLELDHAVAQSVEFQSLDFPFTLRKHNPIFREVSQEKGILYHHEEEDKVDFYLQRTLPHKLSQYGPGIAVGDINGNGLEDFILGGAAGREAVAYMQLADGTFKKNENFLQGAATLQEDMGILLFDVDNDGDLDIYMVSGSIEQEPGSTIYQDRLFINDGNGKFTLKEKMSETIASGSTVRGADFDGDGYLDLFVGGRTKVAQYPFADRSFLLRNIGGIIEDVTDEVAPGLREVGMVTDAIWTDVDGDGKVDLMVVGEFMAITVFRNEGGKLNKMTDTGLENYTGWWNSITAGDFDGDGDIDYVVGNLGENNYYHATPERPLTVLAKDFDQNGSIDPILFAYYKNDEGEYASYPVHFWDDLYGQSILFRRMFNKYEQYALVSQENLLNPSQTVDALELNAKMMKTAYVENLGGGKFKLHPLPLETQTAPVNGMVTEDIDGDGNLDIIMVGNDYGNEVFAGRYDAFTGLILKGDGKGNFRVMGSAESGFLVPGDAKGLAAITLADQSSLYLATQNRDKLLAFSNSKAPSTKIFKPQTLDQSLEYELETGRKVRQEIYYGSGFLSQSSRAIKIPASVKKITVVDFKGQSREVEL
jgi:enediyne biosynthesis protein E4